MISTLCALRLVLIPVDTCTIGWISRVLDRNADTTAWNLLRYNPFSPLPS